MLAQVQAKEDSLTKAYCRISILLNELFPVRAGRPEQIGKADAVLMCERVVDVRYEGREVHS